MTDVLLGSSYLLRLDPKVWRARQPGAPLGTLIAAALLRERGHRVALFDAVLARGVHEWDAALARERPRFAVLFEDNFSYLSKMCLLRMREAAFAMIAAARARGATVIAAGADASDHAGDYLARGADWVLVGEGDATLVELVDRLAGRTAVPLESIAGLASPAGRTPPRPPLADLDALPLPAWDLVDVERYRGIWRRRHGFFSMGLATTRGCPYHCNWCAKPIWGQRYAVRSPEGVAAEIAWLRERFAPDHLTFADDIFGLRPGWLPRFAALMERDPLPFKCLSRADLLLRPGEVAALARAGARTVWLGAESGSQRILDAMEKGTTVGQIAEATARLRAAGLRVGWFLQFGYPGETREELEATRRMVREHDPDELGISVSYPLPGTRFFEAVRDQLGARRNWVDSDDLAMMFRGPFPTAFYRKVHALTHRELKLRRGLRELRAAGRRPASLRPRHLRLAAATAVRWARLPADRRHLERLAARPHDGTLPFRPGMPRAMAATPAE